MGAFEQKEKKAKSSLPEDLPNVKSAAEQHDDGAIFKSDNGKRYRLRHPRWVEVTVRQPKGEGEKKPAAKK